MIKVSVLVPVYGVEKIIERCARSLMEQTYDNIECIFVDDCSPDKSVQILETVLAQYNRLAVKILHNKNNMGVAGTRLAALEASTGDYVLYVDSDDYLEKNAVSSLVEEAGRTNADIVAMDSYFEWNNSKKIYHGAWDNDNLTYSKYLLSGVTLPSLWAHLIKRNLFFDNNIFFVSGLNVGEDYSVLPRLCYHAKGISRLEIPLYHYMQTNVNSYTKNVSDKKIEDIYKATVILSDFFLSKEGFAEALNAGMWLKKVDLMMEAEKKQYSLIDRIPTKMPVETCAMTQQQRLASFFISRKMWLCLYVYCAFYRCFFMFIQLLKGRFCLLKIK